MPKTHSRKGQSWSWSLGHLTSRVSLPSTALRGFDLQGVHVERQGLPILPPSLKFTQNLGYVKTNVALRASMKR